MRTYSEMFDQMLHCHDASQTVGLDASVRLAYAMTANALAWALEHFDVPPSLTIAASVAPDQLSLT